MIEQSELRQLEDRCIQECAPTCMAACPIHVDVRAVTAALSQGDFSTALKVLNKTLPFPGIIGRVCDHPCQSVCKRNEAGDSITIAALEQACADWGGPREKPRILPKRGKRVAIVGGGLSGLTAAFDLARKGYAVVIHEAREQLGGSLWNAPRDILPRQIIRAELAIVEQVGAQVRLNTRISRDAALGVLRSEFDAVYVATGAGAFGDYLVDAVTFATGADGVFAGGTLLRGAENRSPVQSISDGRRAAISIDRYLQQVSLTAARVNEGAYATRLYTDTQGVPPLPVVPMSSPAEGYSRDEAMQEAGRCLLCECMECVKVCEYLAHYGRYPRRYLREIYNNLSIVKGERRSNLFINSCSLCGLCGQVCPEELNMGSIVKRARQEMVKQGRMPPSAHDFALRDMQFSNGEQFALARHRPSTKTSEYVFFPGCQLAGSSPEYVSKMYAYLQDTLGDVGLILGCCGAPADWAGRTDLLQAALTELQEKHRSLGGPQVVLACSSCYQIFKANLPSIPLVSLWTLLDERGLPSGGHSSSAPTSAVVAVHDPCTTRYESQVHTSVRNILQRLGYQIQELELSREKTECCSYGGLMWLANRTLAEAVVQRRLAESQADYVTYCAVCRDFFAARGKRTLYLLDLLYGEPETCAVRPSPGYSQRHENRARLKRQLLKEVWGEAMDGQQEYEAIQIVVVDDVRARLEERLILTEDVQRVIEYAERTGSKLLSPRTGRFLARYRPGAVTYWVEYTPQQETFVIHNAYSHRMEIVEDKQA